MQQPDFLYFITDGNGRTFAVNEQGNVVTTPSPVPLWYTPDGWQEVALQYGRNGTYYGMFRTFTVPLGFVKDGAHIARYLKYTYGIEAVGNLAIAELDRLTRKHRRYFYGALNFSTNDDSQDKFEAEVTEGGLSMMIKANEATTYEIPLDIPEAIDVKMDGLIIKAHASYVIQEGDAADQVTLLGCLFINSEGTFRDILFSSTYNFVNGNNIPPVGPETENYVIRNDGPSQTYNLSFNYQVTRQLNGPHTVFFTVSNGSSYTGPSQTVFSAPMTGGQVLDVNFQAPITLNTGERLFISVAGVGSVDHFTYLPGGTLDITFDFRYRQTICKCLRPVTLFAKLIEKIADGKFTANSTFLSTIANDFVVTCGDAIRGIAGAKIKTSLKDFFTSYNTRFNIGLGNQNDVATIEEKTYFYNQNTIVDLGEVSDCHITSAMDHLWNTLKIGWPPQDYDDVNGRDEFNNTHLYTSPVKRLAKELDLTSVYRADPYGIEFTRMNLEGKVTTDNESDNAVFIINIASDGSGGYILHRPPYSNITGVNAGNTIFNVELSPARCVRAHGNYLHVGMDKLDTGELVFQTTEKNSSLSTTLNGVTITENANIPISSLAPALFLPHVFEFTCKVPLNIVDIMETDPYGKIQFSWLGNTFRGYLIEVAQQPATDGEQVFKLLASRDNDMTKLIYG